MFKRPRLSAVNRLVNALAMLALLFLATACGSPSEAPEINAPIAPQPTVSDGLVLPAVWSTRDLGSPIESIAVAGELGSTIAVAYADGDLQFFNFEGDRITDKAEVSVAKLGDGRYLLLSGVPVTLFPGVSRDGALKVYIHGGQLAEPLVYDLDIGMDSKIAGLCSAPPELAEDGVLRLAFWLTDDPSNLHYGRVVEIGEELVFLRDQPTKAAGRISACMLNETDATVYSAPALSVAALTRRGHRHIVTLDTSGNFGVSKDGGTLQMLTIKDGITVKMAKVPVDMAGTGDTRGGGYPGGILVFAGEDEAGGHRLVFVDPSEITLTAFE